MIAGGKSQEKVLKGKSFLYKVLENQRIIHEKKF